MQVQYEPLPGVESLQSQLERLTIENRSLKERLVQAELTQEKAERLTIENRSLKEQLTQSTLVREQVEQLTTENRSLKEQIVYKEQFIAMIAHDLLSPLTSIINYAKIIVRQLGGQPNPTIRRSAEIITSQSQRIARLVNDLRDSSHIESNRFSLRLASCDIVALVRETADQLRPIAPHHRIELDVPDTLIKGRYDRERLQQVLGNLLDNAIKYSDTETVITIRVWATSDAVYVSVHNVGLGIPSEETSMLFRPFVRLPGVGQKQGSGLGLYISHSIIQAHHGTLHLIPDAELEGDGQLKVEGAKEEQKGVTFCFTLPLS
jgi:signal transduction histidine kinase